MTGKPLPARRLVAIGLSTVFDWTGVFDLAATGFPEGERRAVMSVTRQDAAYALLMVQSPPGNLKSLKISGDLAHIVWSLGPEEMFVDLRGVGTRSRARSTSDWQGEVRGARRR